MDTQKNYKILIIDDDPFIVDMYVLKFKEQGFQIDIAKNGKDGLQKIGEYKPDVVLLDIVMPGMDGFEVLSTLAQQGISPRPKIVLLTNLGQKEDVERGKKLGADDYIIKAHFTPTEVVERVRAILHI